MTTPSPQRIYFLTLTSAVTITLERLWEAFWPAFSVLMVFFSLGLTRLDGVFGGVVHLGLLLGFLFLFIRFLIKGTLAFKFPTREEIRRRIESENKSPFFG